MGQASGGGGMGGGVPVAQIAASVGGNLAANYSKDELNSGFNAAARYQRQSNELYKPYNEGGQSGWDALLRSYGLAEGQNGVADCSGFPNSPNYAWARDQGIQALDRSAASRGRLYSGAQMQGLSQFNQGRATQHLGNYRQGLQ